MLFGYRELRKLYFYFLLLYLIGNIVSEPHSCIHVRS